MRFTLLIFTLLIFCFDAKAETDSLFQGRLTYYVTSADLPGDGKTSLVFMLRGDKTALEIRDQKTDLAKGGARLILDNNKKEYVTLVERDNEKLALTFQTDTILALLASAGIAPAEKVNPKNLKFTRTNETKTISGYSSRKYNFKADSLSGEVWITQDLKADLSQFFQLLKTTAQWDAFSQQLPGFIMQLQMKEAKSGKETSFSVQVDKNEVEESMVIIPEGYRIMNMNSILNEFRKMDPEVYKQMLEQFIF